MVKYILAPEYRRPRARSYHAIRPKVPQRPEVIQREPIPIRREVKRRKLIDNPKVERLYAEYLRAYHRNDHKRNRPLSKLALESWYTSRRHAYQSLGYDPARFDDSLDHVDVGSIGDSFTELDSQLKDTPVEIVIDRNDAIRSEIAEHREIERQYKEYLKAEGFAG